MFCAPIPIIAFTPRDALRFAMMSFADQVLAQCAQYSNFCLAQIIVAVFPPFCWVGMLVEPLKEMHRYLKTDLSTLEFSLTESIWCSPIKSEDSLFGAPIQTIW